MDQIDRVIQEAMRHHQAGRLAQAEAMYRQVLAHTPGHANACGLLGTLCGQTYRAAEAVQLLEVAIRASPSFAENWANFGHALQMLKRLPEAERAYRQAIALRPTFAGAYNGLGDVLHLLSRYEEAEQAYRQAIRLAPAYAEPHSSLGLNLLKTGHYAEAVESLRRALELMPTFREAMANLFFALAYDPDTTPQQYAALGRECDALLTRLAGGEHPAHANDRTPDRPVRLGYVSADFAHHSVNFFFEPILAAHDRSQFLVHCYSDVEMPDEVTARLKSYGDTWRDVRGLDDEALAQRVRDDRIDILVDLASHTERNRLVSFARRPAPVQVTMIGLPDTTGLRAIGYRITDAICDPPGESDELNAEKLVRMPEVAWVYRPPPQLTQPPDWGSDEAARFLSVSNLARVNENVLSAWIAVLKAAPNASLLMQAGDFKSETQRQRIAARFARDGILPPRIDLRPPDVLDGHLKLISGCDLVLDTFPFNGGTTSYHAIAVGTPLLTLAGNRHAGRIGASVLTCLGLENLIARDIEQYIQIAASLASAPGRLRALRNGLRERVLNSALCDGPRYTRHLETEYRRMWRAWCAITS